MNIIDDANRASDVIARIRRLAKRASVEKSLLDLRDVVQDVLGLARYDSAERHVTIRSDLSIVDDDLSVRRFTECLIERELSKRSKLLRLSLHKPAKHARFILC
jgi:hypothetical protein